MKIKRFFAPDIRQAIKLVREELGPEAIILSNRQVDGGIEIVSAIDYDESIFNNNNPRSGTNPDQEKIRTSSEGRSSRASSNRASSKSTPPNREPSNWASSNELPKNERRNNISSRKMDSEVSREPGLVEVKNELKSLRTLLENQLSGFAWNEMQRKSPMHTELLKRMTRMGLSASLCQDIANSISPGDELSHLWYQVQGLLAEKIPNTNDDILNDGGVIALVGSTGVGKTTTVAKLAARYALRHGSRHVALITLDNYRIGAVEQLRAYGRILDIPVRVAAKGDDLSQLVEDFYDRRLVIIDTAGMSQRDGQLEQQLDILRRDRSWLKSYLVLSTTTRLSSMEEVVSVYKQADLAGCILTKLDETTSLGSALSTVIHHQLPVAYVCNGQRVPEDMETARSDALVRKTVSIMEENEGLLEGESLAYNIGGAVS
ncbi:MAG: flagellar biosynthesis protein FlhF [Gammaproteobacteria bacterium]|nr:flagellar biosynthesis protein FlhF [Gammaproteobacteria bacterium]